MINGGEMLNGWRASEQLGRADHDLLSKTRKIAVNENPEIFANMLKNYEPGNLSPNGVGMKPNSPGKGRED